MMQNWSEPTYLPNSLVVLAQRQVGGAPEEVSAFAPLLADLDLAGACDWD
jgi:hypothetical protein